MSIQGLQFKNSSITFTRPNMKTLWNPQTLAANLIAWWKADVGVTFDGSNNLTAWADQSGNNINLAGDATQKPTYTALAQNGLPGINLSGNKQNCAVTDARLAPVKTSPWSVTFAVKWNNGSGIDAYLNIILGAYFPTSGSWFAGVDTASGTFDAGFVYNNAHPATLQSTAHGSTVLVPGKTYIVTVNNSGAGNASGISIYVNGVAENMTTMVDGFGAQNVNTANAFLIGTWNGGAGGSNDTVYEVWFSNRVLTASEAMAATQYLQQRWAVL